MRKSLWCSLVRSCVCQWTRSVALKPRRRVHQRKLEHSVSFVRRLRGPRTRISSKHFHVLTETLIRLARTYDDGTLIQLVFEPKYLAQITGNKSSVEISPSSQIRITCLGRRRSFGENCKLLAEGHTLPSIGTLKSDPFFRSRYLATEVL